MNLKVSDISLLKTPLTPHFSIPTTSDYKHFRSSVTSLQISSLYSWIPTLTNQLWCTLKSLLCFRYPRNHHTEFKPEVSPKSLSTRDPFYKALLNSDGTLRNQKAYKLGSEIFDILGEGGFTHWLYNRQAIESRKNELEKWDLHPLERLFFMFHNKTMSKLSCHFLDNAGSYIRTRFYKEYTATFQKYPKPITPLTPGFAKMLNLDEKHTQNLVSKKKWQELIEYVYQTRKKHFKI